MSEALRRRAAEVGGTAIVTDDSSADGKAIYPDMATGLESEPSRLVEGDGPYSWAADGDRFVTSCRGRACLFDRAGERLSASTESEGYLDDPWLCPGTGALAGSTRGSDGVPCQVAVHATLGDLGRRKPTVLEHAGRGAVQPTLSPDAREVAFVREGAVWRVGLAGGESVRVSRDLQTQCEWPAWSPAGRWIAYVSRAQDRESASIWIAPGEGGDPREPCQGRAFGSGAAPCWSPDSSLLLVNDGVLWLLDPTTGECGALLARPPSHVPAGPLGSRRMNWGGLDGRPAWTEPR